ncbi:ABC transporter permease [Bacteroides sp. GD17]|uniref:ABC transporter permease n=1 Tax=Bacteroides sp. GD17 TaxID=3139826 RepID=UPI0025FDBBA2|nr:ABC transporter permease [uncultured Bacteroides sp.]
MIKYLIEKEFKQLFRNSFLPKLIFIFPCMIMIVMPWAANLEIKNINLNIVDNDHSVISRRLVDKIGASTYFRTTDIPGTYDEALRAIEVGSADIILEIPRDFEKDWMDGKAPDLLVATNAVNGTKGGLGSSYLSAIINDYARELREESPASAGVGRSVPRVEVTTQNLYNPNLNYKLFMVPALMVMLLTMICGFLPALNVVGEKEAGTIEQINVTPVSKFVFIAAKLIPYWVVGFVVLTICFILAWLLYGILPAGHFFTIYGFAVVFLLVVSGLGLVISNHSATLQQAMFVMWFFMLILMLMSGLFTPIHSMPEWAQWIARLNPLKYFVEMMRTVYLRGGGFSDLLPQLGALASFAVIFNLWAVKSYKKSN